MYYSLSLSLLLAALAAVNARVGESSRQLQLTQNQIVAVNTILNPPPIFVYEDEQLDGALLGLCAGDCDNDEDCEGFLVCGQRSSGDIVEGCSAGTIGWDQSDDFCTYPPVNFIGIGPSKEEFTASGVPFFNREEDLPLQMCQGDCDNDDECDEGLICWDRSNKNDTVPGCTGVAEFTEEWNRPSDFCVLEIFRGTYEEFGLTIAPTQAPTTAAPIVPTVQPLLNLVGDEEEPAELFPLGLCEADCDSDEECQEGLICFIRSDEPVPGCGGEPQGREDYCIVDPDFVVELPPCDSNTTDVNGTAVNCVMPDDNMTVAMDATEEPTDVSVNKNGL